MKPEISVVITVFNRSEYLRQTIESLLTQTIESWEAIIVDDHSNEDIGAVVESFKDPRLRYLKNEGKPGPSAGRNVGNRSARADIIAVADSDDIILPRRLELTVNWFKQHPETDLFYASMYTFPDATYKFKYHRYFREYDRNMLYEWDFISHITVAYKKQRILELPYDEDLKAAIDYDMLLNFADRDYSFGYIREPLMLYRRHGDQISSNPDRKAVQEKNTDVIRAKHAQYRLKPISTFTSKPWRNVSRWLQPEKGQFQE